MNLYDRALAGASENSYIQEESLANERAALFYLELGKTKIAKTYMTEAYYDYMKWGALAKVKDLERRYSEMIARTQSVGNSKNTFNDLLMHTMSQQSLTATASSTTSTNKMLDWTTVMKAAEAISSEIILDNLLKKLLKIVLENTASQKGCLILEKSGQLFIEVQKHFLTTKTRRARR